MRKTLLRSFLALGAIAIAASSLSARGQQSQTISMPGYPAIGSPSTVTLSSPGAEPRKSLRFKVASGLKEAMTVTTAIGLSASMEGMAMPAMDLPIMKMTAETAVTGVAPNGDITYDVAFTSMTTEAAPGADPSLAAMMQGAADSITALKGTMTMTDRGINKAASLNLDKIQDPTLKQTLGSLSSTFESLSMPLPEEPVGVGAKWEVRQAVSSGGAHVFQRLQVELTALTADSATLKVTQEQTAPPQTMASPMLQGATMEIEKVAGTGTGTVTVRFGSLVPTSDMNSASTMSMVLDMGGQKQHMAADTRIKTSIAPKK